MRQRPPAGREGASGGGRSIAWSGAPLPVAAVVEEERRERRRRWHWFLWALRRRRHRAAPPCPTAGRKEKTELYLRPRRTMRHQAVLSWLQMTQMTLTKNKVEEFKCERSLVFIEIFTPVS
ncbi:mitochondrial intermembrane space import and assembly protein 40 isoform X2 [Strix aluco]|uniref:mitochondrial intermembrane space import and assembly protein 40 isoform X2 n=1 Tax=Strix aluco TaxID=111821 RepID=UPI003DA66115